MIFKLKDPTITERKLFAWLPFWTKTEARWFCRVHVKGHYDRLGYWQTEAFID